MTEDTGYIGNLRHIGSKRLGAIRTIHTIICTGDRNRPLYMDIHLHRASNTSEKPLGLILWVLSPSTLSLKIRVRLDEIF